MAPSDFTVLITGASGFVGSHIVVKTLEAGYKVRLTVRDESQIPWLKELFGHGDQISWTTVPDLLKPGALDDAVKGVDYVIHTASPIPSAGLTNWKKDYIDPAVNSTESLLESALKEPKIKKVVITSSTVAFVPLNAEELGADRTISEETPYPSVDVNADFGHSFGAYHASKLSAHLATIKFRETRKPPYAIVTIHPDFVFGPLLTSKDSDTINKHDTTAAILWREYNGTQELLRFQDVQHSVHVADVADTHVKALDDSIKDGEKYLLSSGEFNWEELLKYAQKEYPDRGFALAEIPAWKEAFKASYFKVNATKAEKELGIKYKPIEQQFKDIVDHQIALLKKEGK